jgi:hypothetical protein
MQSFIELWFLVHCASCFVIHLHRLHSKRIRAVTPLWNPPLEWITTHHLINSGVNVKSGFGIWGTKRIWPFLVTPAFFVRSGFQDTTPAPDFMENTFRIEAHQIRGLFRSVTPSRQS